MKAIISLLLLLSFPLGAQTANEIQIRQRNAGNTGYVLRTITDPGADSFLRFNNTTNLPDFRTNAQVLSDIGAVASGGPAAFTTLSASGAAAVASLSATGEIVSSGGTSAIGITNSGTTLNRARLLLGSGLEVVSSYAIKWSASSSNLSGFDLELHRPAAQNLRVGKADSATPLTNTLTIGESSRAGTDSNVAGANGTIASGTGTGTGTVSSLIFQTPTVAGAGTGAQTLATRLTLDSSFAAFIHSVRVEGARAFMWNGRSIIKSPADGKIKISPAAETTGATLDFVTDGTLKLRNFADNADGNWTANLQGTTAAAPTIASAGTIAPVTPVVFISGTAAISTITVPATFALGAASAGGGSIILIPTGIFTTDTAGNIALASTAVVNRALHMTWDSGTGKWYPSY